MRWILGVGLGHVGLMLVTWALLGALLGIFNVFLAPFGRFGVRFLVYVRSVFHFVV